MTCDTKLVICGTELANGAMHCAALILESRILLPGKSTVTGHVPILSLRVQCASARLQSTQNSHLHAVVGVSAGSEEAQGLESA
eukprot:1790624-Rhodomonas_salina.2